MLDVLPNMVQKEKQPLQFYFSDSTHIIIKKQNIKGCTRRGKSLENKNLEAFRHSWYLEVSEIENGTNAGALQILSGEPSSLEIK